MNKQAAIKIMETTSKCTTELSKLVPYLKSNCENEAEYEILAKNVAKAMAFIYSEIENPVLEKYPELEPRGPSDRVRFSSDE